MDEDNISDHLKFPRSLDGREWVRYLERALTWQEMHIIEDFKAEWHMNEQLNMLYNHCRGRGMFVPILTDLDGNCLFESLVYYNVAESIEILRESVAYLMYIFKDYKNLLPGVDISLKEMFEFTNDIEVVYSVFKNKQTDEKTIKFYKYTYDTMCKDLSNLYSWSKLPTEIIMRLMSYLFNIEFVILHNKNGNFTTINVYSEVPEADRPPMQKIVLGLLGESHYIPIDFLQPDEELDPMFYVDARKRFMKWARSQQEIKKIKYETRLNRLKYLQDNAKHIDSIDRSTHQFNDLTPDTVENTANLIDFSDSTKNTANLIDFSDSSNSVTDSSTDSSDNRSSDATNSEKIDL
jgi:hypothetical protein